MSTSIKEKLLHIVANQEKVLAVLVDPQKWDDSHLDLLFSVEFSSQFDWIFVGGSTVDKGELGLCLSAIKRRTSKPVIIFPGDPDQIDPHADALLLLSMLNSRDPEFIVGKNIDSAQVLKASGLELIPTAYVLVGSDHNTAVARVSSSIPISDPKRILQTAVAAEQMGKQLVYLESGSGANAPLDPDVLKRCKEEIQIPVAVGSGIRSMSAVKEYWRIGADIVVVGTAIEHDMKSFFRS